MRQVVVFLILSLLSLAAAYGQSSQQGVLQQQIAALKVYGQYLQKGYSVVGEGLTVVGELKSGEFGLHSDYFSSLVLVKPRLAGQAEVTRIGSLQYSILKATQTLQGYTGVTLLSGEERAYILRVSQGLQAESLKQLSLLCDLLTDKALVMGDAQRAVRITGIYDEMQESLRFIKRFISDVLLLVKEREKGLREAERSRRLYNLN